MLVLDRATGTYHDNFFRNLPEFLRPGDLLILNDSRVIPARLYATRAGLHTQHNSPDPTGRIEVLLTQQLAENDWAALVRPSRKVQPGERLLFHAPNETKPAPRSRNPHCRRVRRTHPALLPTPDFHAILNKIGHMPLPPYIHRDDNPEDRDRYQTVFSQQPGSAAAPTAGLHFTPEILTQLKQKGSPDRNHHPPRRPRHIPARSRRKSGRYPPPRRALHPSSSHRQSHQHRAASGKSHHRRRHHHHPHAGALRPDRPR